jgi:DHA1 family inner membrane transport protein
MLGSLHARKSSADGCTNKPIRAVGPFSPTRTFFLMRQLPERTLLLLLAAVQFTHIMDFMIMMPLGPQLMRELGIGPGRFSALVAAYTLSSGLVSLGMAPFIDRFDRRKLLLVVYAGFMIGTLTCALSRDAAMLMVARVISGAFGGLSMATVLAIVSDVVPAERRASAIGVVMTAFSAAAALGVPFGLQLAQRFRWEAPFFFIAVFAVLMWIVAFNGVPPIRGHLEATPKSRVAAFLELIRDANAGRALLFMALLVLGHFSIIPLMSPHFVADVGLPERYLFLVYFVGGVLTVFTGPRIGRLADRHGRVRVLGVLTTVACVVTLAIAHTGPLPVWGTLMLTACFFVFASGRFVPSQAIVTLAVPPSRRGAFMSLSGCARDLASGLASTVGGSIVVKSASGRLEHFNWLGWIAVIASLLALWLARHVRVNETPAGAAAVAAGRSPAPANTVLEV